MRIFRIFLAIVFFVFNKESAFAQHDFNGYLMPTLSINYQLSEKINQAIDIENRNFAYLNDEFVLKAIHVEVLNFTSLQISENQEAGFGIRYRMEADGNEEDELRLHQQYEWKRRKESLFEHRIRIEERFYASSTIFRLRYKTGISIEPKNFCDVLTFSNEFAVEASRANQTELEERLVIEADWELFSATELTIGTQYRFSDFTRSKEHNLFLTAKLSLSL
ncbi:MAG TPA: DUF2490 domain-containing protein [Pelobium sp.]|nr:DUF2490 domain-containing protein [Pelobium sp.]